MDAETWDRQPYWAQRIYAEGLLTEKPWETKIDDSGTWTSGLNSAWDNFGELSSEAAVNDDDDDDDDIVEEDEEAPIVTGNFIQSTQFGQVRYVDKFGS